MQNFLKGFGFIGSISSALSLILVIYPSFDDKYVSLIGILVISFFAFYYFANSIYFKNKYERSKQYERSFKKLNNAFSQIHHVKSLDSLKRTDEDIIECMKAICNELQDFFSSLNKVEVGVCLKLLSHNRQGDATVETILRDKNSLSNGRTLNESKEHKVIDNSDFDNILNSGQAYFFERDIQNSVGYNNSRLEKWPPKKTNNFLMNWYNRSQNWPLCYNVAFTYPIQPIKKPNPKDKNKDLIRGFLCVDSPKKNSFNEKVDKEILKGMSDAIYMLVDQLYHSKLTINEKSDNKNKG